MCGIAGIVAARSDVKIHRSSVRRMCDSLTHRGPDDEGVFIHHNVGLGMRRLSIIDIDGGHQPIFNEDRSIWVVFNGEIYNFKALRKELEDHGHRFATSTDTEVIVHLYEELGADCVLKLRGMFAFALYDDRNRSLLLARDRLGIKPLHYALSRGCLFFGSEIKAILSVAPGLAAETSRAALLQYFYFGYIPDPATAFSQIHKLPPGQTLEYRDGEIKVRRYWDLPSYGTYAPSTEGECLDQLEARLSEAVRIRMIADVPLGALLSGGIDSSTIVALMARERSRPVKTFSIGFKQSDFDEAPFARKVAKQFGTEHHELIVEPDIVDTIQTLTSTLEEPFGDSSMLPTYYVSQMARKYVTVVLSGDGGDEVFGGYERYRPLPARNGNRLLPRAGRFYQENVYPRLAYGFPGRNFAYARSLPWQQRYIEALSFVPLQRNFPVLAADFFADSASPDPASSYLQYLDSAPAKLPGERVLYLDSKTYLPGDILTKVDRMSMAASIEARVPFLDHVFVEWATSLDYRWKVRNGKQKFILTKLAERLGVPLDAIHRPKQGFALPLLHWMRHELKEMVMDLLLDVRTLQRGYFSAPGIRRLLDEFFRGRTDDYLGIWRLMMFELWHRNFLEPLLATTSTAPPSLNGSPEPVR